MDRKARTYLLSLLSAARPDDAALVASGVRDPRTLRRRVGRIRRGLDRHKRRLGSFWAAGEHVARRVEDARRIAA